MDHCEEIAYIYNVASESFQAIACTEKRGHEERGLPGHVGSILLVDVYGGEIRNILTWFPKKG